VVQEEEEQQDQEEEQQDQEEVPWSSTGRWLGGKWK
jgi:hypothetical protein